MDCKEQMITFENRKLARIPILRKWTSHTVLFSFSRTGIPSINEKVSTPKKETNKQSILSFYIECMYHSLSNRIRKLFAAFNGNKIM